MGVARDGGLEAMAKVLPAQAGALCPGSTLAPSRALQTAERSATLNPQGSNGIEKAEI
jgi:hypothetical protein